MPCHEQVGESGQHSRDIVLQFHSPRNEFSRREDAMRHIAK